MKVDTNALTKQASGSDDPDAETAALGQREIEGRVQEVVAKGLIMSAEAEANEALMQVLDHEPDQKKESQSASAQKSSDSAQLSNESLAYNRAQEDEASRQREVDRLLQQLWNFLEEWQPLPGMDLSLDIKELNGLYKQLLQDIMKLCTQSQIEAQANRINGLMLEIIEKIGGAKFPNLLSFFENYGDSQSENYLLVSVLRKITGRFVSPQEMAAARQQRRAGNIGSAGGTGSRRLQSSHRTDMDLTQAKQKKGPDSGQTEEGILYYRSKGNHVDKNQRYRESVREEEQFQFHTGKRSGGSVHNTVFSPFQTASYTLNDIERAEKFLLYIKELGNLYCNPDITAGNEELLGFLMAFSMTKVQIFADYAGVSQEMTVNVRHALEQYFRFYLGQAVTQENSMEAAGNAWLDRRVIQRIYYQVMELIRYAQTPAKGIEKGLQYAWEVYNAKKKSGEHSKCRRYHQHAGFFLNSRHDKDEIKELQYGAGLLDKDWRAFLTSIGQGQNALLQMALSNTPWGLLLEPEGAPQSVRPSGRTAIALIAAAGLCFMLVLAARILGG